MPRPALPIDAVLPSITEALTEPGTNLVIVAPPGAGKTTTVPVEAMPGPTWCAQPRRIAARAAARISARWRGEEVGRSIGYRVRDDARVSKATRTCFVTDGVLLRRLRDDPTLEGLDAIVLDEVHERSARNDLALALARWRQRTTRPDLRVVAMSATADAEHVAAFLGARIVASEGRRHSVTLEHAPPRKDRPLEARVLRALTARVDAVGVEEVGHVLVFLPGAREIRRCAKALAGYATHHGFEVLPLHGRLSVAEQDRALEPGVERKLVLATNVAETSVTIDGVRTVIDSGLARRAEFDEAYGLGQLVLRPIARDSAEQRAGRAGRTAPGHCVRLYGAGDLGRRPAHDEPEIRRCDVAEARLHLAAAGVVASVGPHAPDAFRWLDPPRAEAEARAVETLRWLGALDDSGRITARGRAMARLPVGPRLAHVAVTAARGGGFVDLASGTAALLSERSVRRHRSGAERRARTHDADVLSDLEALRRAKNDGALERAGIDPRGAASVRRVWRRLADRLKASATGGALDDAVAREAALRRALLVAFADRVCRTRTRDGRTELIPIEGPTMQLAPASVVREAEWVVALRIEDRREGARRRLEVQSAAAVELDWIVDDLIDRLDEVESVEFDANRERVVGRSRLVLGNLVLVETPLPASSNAAAEVLAEHARAVGAERFCDAQALASLRARVAFARAQGADVPELDVDRMLTDACAHCSSFAELRRADLLGRLRGSLGAAMAELQRFAPEQVRLDGGRRLKVDYSGSAPSAGSYLQDFFGLSDGPRVAAGRVPVVLHLWAPNKRDVQVTTDLAGFWERHYPGLSRTLRRRYPKHAWPEDPVNAEPPAPRRRGRKPRGR